MLKWFEKLETEKPNMIFSRIRLVRNWNEYQFPSRLTDKQGSELIKRLEFGLKDLGELDHKNYEFAMLGNLKELDRLALRERRILNTAAVTKKGPIGVLVSSEEDTSLVFNSDDHIRFQLLAPGLCLDELWKQADQIDDYINARFPYAFDDKYGYMTSFPTNVGTGLRAGVVIHLPTLSLGRKFQNLVGEMSRFGTAVRGVYGEGSENYGALYEISNQKTLGLTEKEIIDLVGRVAGQLNSQESSVRALSLKSHRLEREDEVYKSYGVLKYARRLSMKDAMSFLSQLMAGVSDGLVELVEPCSIYRLMLGIQPANLQKLSDHPLGKEDLDVARAGYLRVELPELK